MRKLAGRLLPFRLHMPKMRTVFAKAWFDEWRMSRKPYGQRRCSNQAKLYPGQTRSERDEKGSCKEEKSFGMSRQDGSASGSARQDGMRVTPLALLQYFTRHRTAANLLLVLMLGAGLFALPRMTTQFFPDVVVDNVTITIRWPGAGAGDVDRAIVQRLEPQLMAVEGVAATVARAQEGRATITVEFEPGANPDSVTQAIQDAVESFRDLPEDAEAPEIRRAAWADRVTNVVIAGHVCRDQLARFADEFAARLYEAGITRTTIQGVAPRQITVEVPGHALVAHGLTLEDIARAIGGAVSADPAGELAGGMARLRAGSERRSAEALAALPVLTRADGSTLRLGEIATIREEPIDRGRAYFVGDLPAVALRIDRPQGGDAIAIQRKVEELAAEMTQSLPPGVSITLMNARADLIAGRIALLLKNGALGLALVLLLLFLFLNARTAFWVAAGIPAAMLAAVALMWAAGMSLNMISLFALILALGIVVDDAIVVGEHADWRLRLLGESPAEAAENAATRMAGPVFAASLTTIIAFGGLTLVGGRFGELIADIPFTVIAVLAASLVECFLILPNHMRHALMHASQRAWYDLPSHLVNRGFTWVRERLFRPFVHFVVALRYPVLAGVIVLAADQAAVFLRGDVPWRFFVPPEQGTVTINFVMAPDASRADTEAMVRELARAATAVGQRLAAQDGVSPIVQMLAEVGGNTGRPLAAAEQAHPDRLGSLTIELVDPDVRSASSFEFLALVQDEVKRTPLVEEISFRTFGFGPGDDSLSVDLFGAETETLKAAAEALKSQLAALPEVSGLQDNLSYDREEWLVELTPLGRALGFTPERLSRELRARLSGIEAATFPDGPRTGSIRVVVPEAERSADFLEATLLSAGPGRSFPLADLVSVTTRQGFSTIERRNGLHIVTVSGMIAEDDPARAREILLALEESILPALAEEFGIGYRLSGLAEQERAFLSDTLLGAVLCLLAIYATLAWIFASWTRPFVVMAVIPFGLIGVVYGHQAWGMALTMFSVVGMMGLAGIIINDSIVLVAAVDDYAKRLSFPAAIVEAATVRLRPVFLTTATTVIGLAPLLFERSTQALFLKPTVITLVYGLSFGLALVLLIVPSLLAVSHDLARIRRSLVRGLRLGRRSKRARSLSVLPLAGVAWILVLAAGFLLPIGEAGRKALAAWPLLSAGSAVAEAFVFMLLAVAGLAALWLIAMLSVGAYRLSLRRGAPPNGERAEQGEPPA